MDNPSWLWFDNAMQFLWTPLYKWPTALRHTYLCLYPLALVLRVLVGLVLLLCMIVHYASASMAHYFTQVWRGERPEPYI